MGNHCYNYKCTIGKERKCLRESESRHSEHSASVDSKKFDCHGGIMSACW